MPLFPPKGNAPFYVNSIKEKRIELTESRALETIESYPINQYVRAEILRNSKTKELYYHLKYREISDADLEILDDLIRWIKSSKGADFGIPPREEREDYLKEKIRLHIAERGMRLKEDVSGYLQYLIVRDYIGYGRIDELMKDGNIEDISCDGVGVPIFVYHRKYQHLPTNISFDSEQELNNYIVFLAQRGNKQISVSDPILDATIQNGSRVNATFGREVTSKGGTFTIRLFGITPLTPVDLVLLKTATPEMFAYLWLATELGKNVLVLGGTGVGKTSTLNAISMFIPPTAKIVSVEDTREINIPHKNWISAVTRSGVGEGRFISGKAAGEIDMFDLLVSALRQRPDYLIVGEIRGKEAYNLFQAMSMGQTTLTTMHAQSIDDVVSRLENQPLNIPRTMLTSINIVVEQSIVKIIERPERRITEISEIVGIDPESSELTFNKIFSWDSSRDRIVYSGESELLNEIKRKKEFEIENGKSEVYWRAKLIQFLCDKGVRNFNEIWSNITQYSLDPEGTISGISKENNDGGNTSV